MLRLSHCHFKRVHFGSCIWTHLLPHLRFLHGQLKVEKQEKPLKSSQENWPLVIWLDDLHFFSRKACHFLMRSCTISCSVADERAVEDPAEHSIICTPIGVLLFIISIKLTANIKLTDQFFGGI